MSEENEIFQTMHVQGSSEEGSQTQIKINKGMTVMSVFVPYNNNGSYIRNYMM